MNWGWGQGRNGSSFAQEHARRVLPSVILEIEPGFVVGAHLDVGGRSVRRIATRELEPQTLNPAPGGSNFANLDRVRQAVQGVSDVIGHGTGRLCMLVPDASVRVAVLIFEALEETGKEADQLVRWRIKDILPYPLEEAKISCQVLWKDPGNVGVLALAARNSLLAEYAAVLGVKNVEPDLILPSTLALMPLLSEKEGEGQMLVHICSGWVTTVVAAGARILSWRNKALSSTDPPEVTKEVIGEVARVLASSQDHLQVSLNKILLCARPPALKELASEMSKVISKEVESLAPAPGPVSHLSQPEKSIFDAVGAPIAGVIRNFDES